MNQDQIMSGRITFSTDAFFIQLTDNGQFIDLSGDAVVQPNFEEFRFHHHQASVFGHMGQRNIEGEDSDGLPKIRTLIAKSIALKSDIELRAFKIWQENRNAPALENWLRAERELLGLNGVTG